MKIVLSGLNFSSVRKAKQDWLTGKKIAPVGFQLQYKPDVTEVTPQIHATLNITTLFEKMAVAAKATDSPVNEELLQTAMVKTKEIIGSKAQRIPSIVPWIYKILASCRTGNKEDLLRYIDIVSGLSTVNNQIIQQWILIHRVINENEQTEQSGLLLDLQTGLEKHSTLLNSISELFNYQPFPSLKQFIGALGKEKKKLKSFIDSFDRDPAAARASSYDSQGFLINSSQQILQHQFNTLAVQRVVAKMRCLLADQHVSRDLQYELAQQVIYINAIGKDHPFKVGNKTYTDLTQLSRSELLQLTTLLIARVRMPVCGEHTRLTQLKARLNLIAVMREQYFRATGQFVNSTQILSLLMSLNEVQYNLLMEIDTKDNRRVTTRILAAMQWVLADGGSVDVCLPNQNEVLEDYSRDGGKLFFNAMGIPSGIVEANAVAGTYQTGGINYTTIPDLAFYRSRAQEDQEALTTDWLDKPLSSHLILNCQNFSGINSRTMFDLTRHDDTPNPRAWIYPLINEFIQKKEFRNIDVLSGDLWNEEDDKIQLGLFLKKHATTKAQKQQLRAIPDTTWATWIDMACKAQQLVEGEDFIIASNPASTWMAVPVYLNVPQQSFLFNREIQELLHARLQKQYPSQTFKILSKNEQIINSITTKELFDYYKHHGRIMSVSGKAGSKNELTRLMNELDIKAAYQVPLHDKHLRRELALPQPAPITVQVNKLKNIMASEQGQPIIVLAKDAHQAEELFKEFSKQFVKEGKDVQLAAFTGQETEVTRREWNKHNAGQSDSITIVIPSLLKEMNLITESNKGFYGIEMGCDRPKLTKKFIDLIASSGKTGHYVALYEEDGHIISGSWLCHSGSDKENIIQAVSRIVRKKNQELAVEQHFRNAVSEIQLGVLQQFEDWQAFLHLLYPQKEWKTLDRELFIIREELIDSLGRCWDECLERSNPENIYQNPYIRRGKNKKLQTTALNTALTEYEHAANLAWIAKREILKGKTAGKMEHGSVNAMRCQYLEETSLQEQLKCNKLATRQKRKDASVERKKTKSIIDTSLDLNGAMLAYSDVPKEPYRIGFVKNQLRTLVALISKEVECSSLSYSVKSILTERLSVADSFLAVAGILNSYFTQIDSDNLAEKYRMQPIVNELLRVYEYSGLQLSEARELRELRNTYINNVTLDLVGNLEHHLSWSLEKNRGLGIEYWLERTAVKSAAHDILMAVQRLKEAMDVPARKEAMKSLYKILVHHQVQLEEVWIFSLGHKNTRDLINQTLKTLNELTFMGSGLDEVDASLILGCREEAHTEQMITKFHHGLEQIERRHSRLNNNLQWDKIKQQCDRILLGNKTVYVIDDLYYFLTKVSNELSLSNSTGDDPLLKAVIELRGELRIIWDTFYQNHQSIINESRYFKIKAETIRNHLQGLADYKVKQVKINHGQNGFADYYDLIVEGSGSSPLLEGFLNYNSRLGELNIQQNDLMSQKKTLDAQITLLKKLQNEHMSEADSWENKTINVQLFPESCHASLLQVQLLKNVLTGTAPEDWSSFSQKERELFHDREVLQRMDAHQFTLEQVEQLSCNELKAQLIVLYNKVNNSNEANPAETPSLFSRVLSFMTGLLIQQESNEDWRYHFAQLKASVTDHLHELLQPALDQLIKRITSELKAEEGRAVNATNLLTERLHFVHQKIAEEQKKSGIRVKRFEHLNQLYDFELKLRNHGNIMRAPVTMHEPVQDMTVQLVPIEKVESDESAVLGDEQCSVEELRLRI